LGKKCEACDFKPDSGFVPKRMLETVVIHDQNLIFSAGELNDPGTRSGKKKP